MTMSENSRRLRLAADGIIGGMEPASGDIDVICGGFP